MFAAPPHDKYQALGRQENKGNTAVQELKQTIEVMRDAETRDGVDFGGLSRGSKIVDQGQKDPGISLSANRRAPEIFANALFVGHVLDAQQDWIKGICQIPKKKGPFRSSFLRTFLHQQIAIDDDFA